MFVPLLRVTSTILFLTEPVSTVSTCTRNSILTHTPPGWTGSLSLPWQTCLLFKEPKPTGQGRRQAQDRRAGDARPREVQRCHLPPLSAPGAGPRPRCCAHRHFPPPGAPALPRALLRSPGQGGRAEAAPGAAGAGRRRGNPGQAGRARLSQCGQGQEEEEEAEAEPWRLRLCAGRRSVAFRP